MTQKLFTVHDSKAEAYLPPFMARTNGEATRMFEASCKNEKSQFFSNPSDFTLVQLGEFDERTGLITSLDKPLIIENASSYVQ